MTKYITVDEAVKELQNMFPEYSEEILRNILSNSSIFRFTLENDMNAAIDNIVGGESNQNEVFKLREEDKYNIESPQFDINCNFEQKPLPGIVDIVYRKKLC